MKDSVSVPLFIQILGDPRKQETVRMAALVALGQFRDPQSLRARLSLVYQEKVPPALVARRCRTWHAWGSCRPTISHRSSRIPPLKSVHRRS